MNQIYSQAHLDIINNNIIQFMDDPAPNSITNQPSYENYSLSVAITKYVAIGTELASYNATLISNGVSKASITDNQKLTRLMDYMINNGKGTLRYYVSKDQNYFYQEVSDEVTTEGYAITIALIADPIGIMFFLIMFIPFILKVQSSLLKIYLHLCQFKDGSIQKWLETCNSSAADIKASISQMRQIYIAENFEIKLLDEKETPDNSTVKEALEKNKIKKRRRKRCESDNSKYFAEHK